MAEKKQQTAAEKVAANTTNMGAKAEAEKKEKEKAAHEQAVKLAAEKEKALEKAKKDEIEENKKKKKAADQLAKEEAAKADEMRKVANEVAQGQEKSTGMRIFMAPSYPDYHIVLKPKNRVYDEKLKKVKTEPGKYIQFIAGRYVTKDKDEIDFLMDYAKKHPSYVVPLEDHLFVLQRAINKVKEEELARAVAQMPAGSQGLTSGG